MEYLGMKWYKCDFQMQTPGDKYNWSRDCQAYLTGDYSEEELINSVDSYLQTCHDVELNVIAVTDHNFIGRKYLEKLQERNIVVAQLIGRDPLFIFPGFEVEISQGMGIHLLAIFDPNTPLDEIDDLVTTLGLSKGIRVDQGSIRPSDKTFNNVIEAVQNHPRFPGIIIAAHPLAESGLLNDKFITEYFQKEIFVDERLLAIEVPRPIDTLTPGWKNLILANEQCFPHWRRKRPIAAIMSSDCYSLKEGEKGYIGKRHTWIQSSNISIESLRQALVDHDSRIRLSYRSPSEEIKHSRINKLSIKNVAFLDDQEITFSPNLNCVIGGRGSGKSSIIEYLRMCTDLNYDKENDQVKRLRNTICDDSNIKIEWVDSNGLSDNIKLNRDFVPDITDREIEDKNIIFNAMGVKVYSQREITQMAQNNPSLLSLIDTIAGDILKSVTENEKEVINQIKEIEQKESVLNDLKSEQRELKQEIIELERKWKAFEEVKEENEKNIKAQKAKKFVNELIKDTEEAIDEWLELFNDLRTPIEILDDIKEYSPDYLNTLVDRFNLEKIEAYKEIKETLTKYRTNFRELSIYDKDWEKFVDSVRLDEENFIKACKERGLDPDQLELLKEIQYKIVELGERLQKKDERILRLMEQVRVLPNLYENLHTNWREQFEVRLCKIDEVMSSDVIPKICGTSDEKFIKIDIKYMGDENDFFQIWNNIPLDRRTLIGKNWDEIGEVLYSHFLEDASCHSPWILFDQWLNESKQMPLKLERYHIDLKEHFYNNIFDEWLKLLKVRIKDSIDITLYRNDGSRAGSLLDNGLSDGQKNTAILTLLFAVGNNPIIIDQPEDELDSDFIYNDLVPILRNVKQGRQIIIVTHNANLPVNGDAELIYALKTEMGRGKVRTQGGLDNPEVKDAILDIMEGSEEAFRRRSEKYYS